MEAFEVKCRWVGVLCFWSCPHTQEEQNQPHLRAQGLRTMPGASPLDYLLQHLSSDSMFSLNGPWTSVRQVALRTASEVKVSECQISHWLSMAGRGVLCLSVCPILPSMGIFFGRL